MCAALATVITQALFHFYGMVILTCQHTTTGRLSNSQTHRMSACHPLCPISAPLSRLSGQLSLWIQLVECVYASLYSCFQSHQPWEVCTVIIMCQHFTTQPKSGCMKAEGPTHNAILSCQKTLKTYTRLFVRTLVFMFCC